MALQTWRAVQRGMAFVTSATDLHFVVGMATEIPLLVSEDFWQGFLR